MNNNAWIWTLDKMTGEVLSKYACFDIEEWNGTRDDSSEISSIGSCVSALEVIEDSDADQGQQKGALYITTGGSTIVRSATFADSFVTSDYAENVSFHRFEAEWAFPQLRLNDVVMQARQYDTDSLLLASPFGAVMIELEQSASPYQGDGAKATKLG